MRTIPIFLIGIGLLAACTTEPDRPRYEPDPEPPPVLVCEESSAKDADCGELPADAPAGARVACCLDGDGEGDADVCGTSNRCLLVGAAGFPGAGAPGTFGTVCQSDDDCDDGLACGGGLCVACLPPKDPT